MVSRRWIGWRGARSWLILSKQEGRDLLPELVPTDEGLTECGSAQIVLFPAGDIAHRCLLDRSACKQSVAACTWGLECVGIHPSDRRIEEAEVGTFTKKQVHLRSCAGPVSKSHGTHTLSGKR